MSDEKFAEWLVKLQGMPLRFFKNMFYCKHNYVRNEASRALYCTNCFVNKSFIDKYKSLEACWSACKEAYRVGKVKADWQDIMITFFGKGWLERNYSSRDVFMLAEELAKAVSLGQEKGEEKQDE